MTHKISLLLDLDDTTFIALTEQEFAACNANSDLIKRLKRIHPAHSISTTYIQSSGFYFYLLNPSRLKTMIQTIYDQGDDIIIFTAGLWLPPVLTIVAELCGLEAEYAKKFQNALFLNPQHDGEQLAYSIESVRRLLKGYRLHGLFRMDETLRDRHFILLDDSAAQISSCKDLPYIEGIRATTNTEDTSFYDAVIEQMKTARAKNAQGSPTSAAYSFTKAILDAYKNLEQAEEAASMLLKL